MYNKFVEFYYKYFKILNCHVFLLVHTNHMQNLPFCFSNKTQYSLLVITLFIDVLIYIKEVTSDDELQSPM